MPSKPHSPHRARVRLGICLLEDRLAPAYLPVGFAETIVASGLSGATSMEFAPDGKIFITEKAGTMEIWQNEDRLNADFFSDNPIQVETTAERGLLSVAFDPDYANNRYVYVFYTTPVPAVHNRVSRFTADADGMRAVPGSETIVLDLPAFATHLHHGGALHFGPDGKLYVGVGDNFYGPDAQSLDNPFGKILRLNSDGTIPTDNPFYNSASGSNRAIWAMGLRNPYTFAFQPGTGRMFINDVGEASWEEINEGAAGANFGWPLTEGDFNQVDFPDFTRPVFTYDHTVGRAVTGGAFYNPASPQFAPYMVGDYFYGDFMGSFVKRLDLQASTPSSFDFAIEAGGPAGTGGPVDVQVDDEGALYYLTIGAGILSRVTVAPDYMPVILEQPLDVSVSAGASATFSVVADGHSTSSYQWQRDGSDIVGATSSSYVLPAVSSGDHLATFRVIVYNGYGQVASRTATLSVDAPEVSSVAVNAGAAQRSRVTELSVTFNAVVSFAGPVAAAFTLTSADNGVVSFTATANVVQGVTVVTLNGFTGAETEYGSLLDGRYTLTTVASQVNLNGRPMVLDNTFEFHRFYGDMNGDMRVDISDFGLFSLAYFQPHNYIAALDVNNDGRIDIADFGQFSVRFFTTLP